jgi:hypothetical protein
MLDSVLDIDFKTKKKITEIINQILFPLKCYLILILLLLVLMNYNIYKKSI